MQKNFFRYLPSKFFCILSFTWQPDRSEAPNLTSAFPLLHGKKPLRQFSRRRIRRCPSRQFQLAYSDFTPAVASFTDGHHLSPAALLILIAAGNDLMKGIRRKCAFQ